jgi:hypothetical protein
MANNFEIKSHFFTLLNAISSGAQMQTMAQCFGPVSTDEFNITSTIPITPNAKAFAICKGRVLMQPQKDNETDTVNLILKPYEQPIKGLSIKYFIYRGLKRSDFFDNSSPEPKVIPPSASSSDFINKINNEFTNFFNPSQIEPLDTSSVMPGNTALPFLAKYIGYNSDLPEETLIDSLFFKQTEFDGSPIADIDFELPMIDIGLSLGTFIGNTCGIDVVINYGDYAVPADSGEFIYNLKYARANHAKIILEATDSDFQKKLKREHIYNFLDISAYYGYHFQDDGKVLVNNGAATITTITTGGTTPINSALKTIKANTTDVIGLPIFINLIKDKFYSQHRFYIYIQSDRGRTYNYYGNYNISDTNLNCIKVGIESGNLVETKFETDGWPILIDKAVRSNSTQFNKVCLKFKTDTNVELFLHALLGRIENGTMVDNSFYLNYYQLFNNQDASFTQEIQMDINQDSSKNICNFCLLIYKGSILKYQVDEIINFEGNLELKIEYSDNINDKINSLNCQSLFKNLNNNTLNLSSTQYYSSFANVYLYNKESKTNFLYQIQKLTKRLNNTSNPLQIFGTTTFSLTLRSFLGKEDKLAQVKINTNLENVLFDDANDKNINEKYEIVYFTEGFEVIKGIKFNIKKYKPISADYTIAMTLQEETFFNDIIDSTGIVNPTLNFSLNENNFISMEGINYSCYKINLLGENEYNPLKLFLTNAPFDIYSLDGLTFFTIAYSKLLNQINKTSNNQFLSETIQES